MTSRETYGAQVKRRREALGLSQEWLANAAGTDRTHVSKVENGRIVEPNEPIRSTLLAALERAERDRGITPPAPEEGGPDRNDGTSVHEDDEPLLDLVMLGARELTPAGRKILLRQIEEIREMQRQLREDIEREQARDRRRSRTEGGGVPTD